MSDVYDRLAQRIKQGKMEDSPECAILGHSVPLDTHDIAALLRDAWRELKTDWDHLEKRAKTAEEKLETANETYMWEHRCRVDLERSKQFVEKELSDLKAKLTRVGEGGAVVLDAAGDYLKRAMAAEEMLDWLFEKMTWWECWFSGDAKIQGGEIVVDPDVHRLLIKVGEKEEIGRGNTYREAVEDAMRKEKATTQEEKKS